MTYVPSGPNIRSNPYYQKVNHTRLAKGDYNKTEFFGTVGGGIGGAFSPVNGFTPGSGFDFNDGNYMDGADGEFKAFTDIVEYTGGLGTFHDSTGKLVHNAHNLLPWSSTSGWGVTGGNSTVPDSALAPDGTMTASTVTFNGGADEQFNISANYSNDVSFGIWVRVISGDPTGLRVGTRSSNDVSFTPTATWVLFSNQFTDSAFPRIRGLSTTCVVEVWGAQLNDAALDMAPNPDTGDSYVKTEAAAVYMPRVGAHVWDGTTWGPSRLRSESEARTNLALWSADLSDPVWASGTETTTTPAGDTARVQFSGLGNLSNQTFNQGVTTTGEESQTHTVSMQVRSYNGGNDQVFRLKCAHAGVANYFSPDLTATSAWQDFSFSQLFTASAGTGIFGGVASRVDDGAADIEVRYVQVEQNTATASSYIITNGAAVTRPAETFIQPWENLGLPTDGVNLFTGLTTLGAGWSDNGDGSYTCDGTQAGASDGTQLSLTVLDATYIIDYEIIGRTAGAALVEINSGAAAGPYRSVNGRYTERLKSTADNGSFRVEADVDFVGTVKIHSIERVSMPAAVSFAQKGLMTYADNDLSAELFYFSWSTGASELISHRITTFSASVGKVAVRQESLTENVNVLGTDTDYAPGSDIPFSVAGRHGSTFINGAHEGILLTEDTTPTTLPDLSTTDLLLWPTFMGYIDSMAVYPDDIEDDGITEASER